MEEKLFVEVRTYEEGDYRFAERIERTSIRCPFCETIVMPTYMLMTDVDNHRHNVFCQCPNCRETLVLEYERFNMSEFRFKQIHPNPTLKKEIFSDTIKEISPSFTDIYNQAYGAFQLGLNHVCGMGFRKALEFLIKDYAIRKRPDAEESIKKALLGVCINNYVDDVRVKEMANRATWLGNDETHYVRLYDDRDVTHLMALIKVTIHWIEMEETTRQYYEEIEKRR